MTMTMVRMMDPDDAKILTMRRIVTNNMEWGRMTERMKMKLGIIKMRTIMLMDMNADE